MAKVYNYVLLMTGLALLLSLSGIEVAGVSALLAKIGLVQGAYTFESALTQRIIAILGTAAGAGIVVGLLTRSNPENYVVVGIITSGAVTITIFATLAFAIINAGYSYAAWIGHITALIIGTLTVGFIFSLLDWFRGND